LGVDYLSWETEWVHEADVGEKVELVDSEILR
jgi:hypothetical protein